MTEKEIKKTLIFVTCFFIKNNYSFYYMNITIMISSSRRCYY